MGCFINRLSLGDILKFLFEHPTFFALEEWNVSTASVPGPLVGLCHLADAVPREEVVGEVELLEVRQDRVQLGQALVVNVGVGQVQASDPAQTTYKYSFHLFYLSST